MGKILNIPNKTFFFPFSLYSYLDSKNFSFGNELNIEALTAVVLVILQ